MEGDRLRLEIFPHDLEASRAFYCDVLGFSVVDARSAAGHLFLAKGEVLITLTDRSHLDENHPAREAPKGERYGVGVEFVIPVHDLNGLQKTLRALAYPIQTELTQRPWAQKDLRLLDPDGLYLRLTEKAA